MLKKFMQKNRNWCEEFLKTHPLDAKNINNVYLKAVKKYLKDAGIVYDVGGGKHCRYIDFVGEGTMVYALDISAEELDANSGIKEKIVTDVCKDIPIPYGKVDMITSSSVVEHLTEPVKYYENAYNALKSGGIFINMFPCRYAVFAMVNRVLPKKFARNLLYFFQPGAKKDCGFPAYYKGLYYKRVIKDLRDRGFRIKGVYLRYLQADYYTFFVPLFLVNYVWDAAMKKLGIKNGATHMLIVAEKI